MKINFPRKTPRAKDRGKAKCCSFHFEEVKWQRQENQQFPEVVCIQTLSATAKGGVKRFAEVLFT